MSSIFKLAAFAVVSAGSAVMAAGAVVVLSPKPVELRAARAEAPFVSVGPQAKSPHASKAILKSGDGHFWADGEVNGRSVRFLVDTGATAVALTPADAAKLGIDPAQLHYSYRVVTAGGQIRAASVRLASMTVAGARLDDVDALVMEKGLDSSLLGMTYLGRLSRFEATRGALVLEP
ncbi:TIGR02281 family clan AA aspartic protease [Phenylobacterium soli]|uniref:TIGR02281 family clan AA aspartic protease n=1 Tax=Phenylobacterium soli TaxID=2170551 RepID=A0A328ARB8_9CAUL|nr:TIGR02281 family clan AA aspartic protease [Phenylobacterium soli]RAK56074.1 TIGR02281 family clan AA aspartic protease [Phenylobacterium soli]